MRTDFLEYSLGGKSYLGYAAIPEVDTFPAVIIAHTWAGRDAFVDCKAEQLAELGYLGFALDMYGDGVVGSSVEENSAMMQPLMDDRAELAARVTAAYQRVVAIDGVDASKIAIFGYCFGGLVAFDLARTGSDIRGSASLHGFLIGSEQLDQEPINAKLLALHGMRDPMVGDDQLQSFYREMSDKNVDWQMHIYGDAMHAFTNPDADNPSFGTQYSQAADRRSWALLVDFLQEVFA